MIQARKIVLHAPDGYRPGLDAMVRGWMLDGVEYVGVVGFDAARIEDIIDDLCVGDGSNPYFMLTAAHDAEETLDDAIALAEILDPPGAVEIVRL